MKNIFVLTILGIVLLATAVKAQVATGGQFTLEQAVLANGGATSGGGGTFNLQGTAGQSIAGQKATTGAFSVHAGFWNGTSLGTTAATATLGGQVTTADGRGIRNVLVTMTAANGTSRTVVTGSFGYYRFDEIEVGQTVIITVRSKRFSFAEPTLIFAVAADSGTLNFVAYGQN